jgi:hypothetical protein
MKKLILMSLAAGLVLSSCNKTEVETASSYTPTAAVEAALRKQAPTASDVSYTEVSPTAVEASYNLHKDALVAGISKAGKLLYNGDAIVNAELPAIALDYLTATYPGYKLLKAVEKKKDDVTTGFVANISHNSKFYHIHFDATGKFVESAEKNGKGHCKGEKLTQEQLPDAIKTYLNTTYPNYKFTDAIKFVKDDTTLGYGVRILTADAKEVGLLFDAKGVFVKAREGHLGHGGKGLGKRGDGGFGKHGHGRGNDGISVDKLSVSDMPATIKTYLDTKYAGYKLEHAVKISKEDTVLNYVVDIKHNDKKIYILFDGTGAFVKEGKK